MTVNAVEPIVALSPEATGWQEVSPAPDSIIRGGCVISLPFAIWPTGVAYQQFATFDLLDSVRAILNHYRRWTL